VGNKLLVLRNKGGYRDVIRQMLATDPKHSAEPGLRFRPTGLNRIRLKVIRECKYCRVRLHHF